jgi:hypothetical protein
MTHLTVVPQANHEVAFTQEFAQLLATERVGETVQFLDGHRVTLPARLVPARDGLETKDRRVHTKYNMKFLRRKKLSAG